MKPIEMLYAAVDKYPDALAIDCQEFHLTYRELRSRIHALASGLQRIDSKPQSRVAICGYNTLEHVLAILAIMAADKVWVLLNPRNSVK